MRDILIYTAILLTIGIIIGAVVVSLWGNRYHKDLPINVCSGQFNHQKYELYQNGRIKVIDCNLTKE